MAGHFTIELKGMRFFAEHGMYQEEMLVGNEFEVDLAIGTRAPKKIITTIDQTVNYVEVYRIVQDVFAERKLLLETCAMEIAGHLEEQFDDMESLDICIRKLNPPITNFSGSVGITYSKNYKQ